MDLESNGDFGTPLRTASLLNFLFIVRLLLDRGAKIDFCGPYGDALQAAAANGHVSVARLLLEEGANISQRAGFYGTALQAAAYHGHIDMVELLLDWNADIEEEGYAKSALHAAAEGGHQDVMALIMRKKRLPESRMRFAQPSHLRKASQQEQVEVIEFLLQHGFKVNDLGGQSMLPIQMAAKHGSEHVLELLIMAGADVDATELETQAESLSTPTRFCIARNLICSFYSSGSPLAEASRRELSGLAKVRRLLSSGARLPEDVDGRNHLLGQAFRFFNRRTCPESLDDDDDDDVRYPDGQFPCAPSLEYVFSEYYGEETEPMSIIQLAVKAGKVSLVKTLLAKGADPMAGARTDDNAALREAVLG
ncbi:ankyrin, partial [Colletotrichum sublineola]